MTWGLIGLMFCYGLLALLLLNVLLSTPWGWPVKAAAAAMVAGVCLASYRSAAPLSGWPAAQRPPEQFHLLGVHVEEADKGTGAGGAIYLWVIDVAHEVGQRVPRAYALPYFPPLHAKAVEAANKLRKNLPQLGEVAPGAPAAATAGSPWEKTVDLRFFDMPDPLFPDR